MEKIMKIKAFSISMLVLSAALAACKPSTPSAESAFRPAHGYVKHEGPLYAYETGQGQPLLIVRQVDAVALSPSLMMLVDVQHDTSYTCERPCEFVTRVKDGDDGDSNESDTLRNEPGTALNLALDDAMHGRLDTTPLMWEPGMPTGRSN
ncbi:hypothetical protein GCM10027093_08510 [Paraburkholderia jirisanensis]